MSTCPHIQPSETAQTTEPKENPVLRRVHPSMTPDADLLEELTKDFDVLPLFESSLYEKIYLKHYSLKNNEFLSHHWSDYKNAAHKRQVAPFQLFDARDDHFHNQDTVYLPQESIFKKTNHKYKLRTGPGVDERGQIPLPCELFMKREQLGGRRMAKHKDKNKESKKPSA